MAFFDFLTSPKQDIPELQREQADLRKKKPQPPDMGVPDDEGLRLSQYKNEEAQSGPKTFDQLRQQDEGHRMAVEGLERDYSKAWSQAIQMVDSIPGGHSFASQGTSFGRVDDATAEKLGAVRAELQKAAGGKARVSAAGFADDFQNLAKEPSLAKYSGSLNAVAEMFRRAAASQKQASISKESYFPEVATPEMVAQERQNLATLQRRQQEAKEKLDTIGLMNPERPGLENAVTELEKAKKQAEKNLKDFVGQNSGAQPAPAAPPAKVGPPPVNPEAGDKIPLPADIKKNSASGGRRDEDLRLAVVAALKKAEEGHGLELGDLVGNEVDYATALRTMLPVLDPSGKIQTEMLALAMKQKQGGQVQQQKPTEPGGQQVPAESDATLADLKMKQAERRALLGSLGQDPSSQNWLSAIVTILLSAAIGSERALRVMGYASKTNTLKYQLDLLNQEIEEDMALLKEQRQAEREIKREAARRMTRQEDQSEQRKWELGKMVLQHQLIIKRNEQRGNPETALMKKLSAEFQRSLGLASKYSKAKDDPFVSDADKLKAKTEFERFMRKAVELDSMLREIGGTAEAEEGGVSMEDDE